MTDSTAAGEFLLAEGVSKHFGGIAALRDARFSLRRGEVHALMGENGAGKSTLVKIMAGSESADRGTLSLDGQPVAIHSPLDAQRLGIAPIYQELDLFPNLTVGENIVIGNRDLPNSRLEPYCRPFLAQVGLDVSVRRLASSLPIGQRQLLAIARALSLNARVILMDEPTSSLFDDAVERLFGLIRGLRDQGVAIVYVSHKMDEIFRICDRATVLRDGETAGTLDLATATPAELIRLMVGRDLLIAARPYRRPPGEVLLEAANLTTRRLRDVSFSLHRGEVLGVAGLVGAGRSELGAALFGIDPIRSGTLRLRGQPFRPASPGEAMARGIGLVPEDRRLDGLMMNMSVLENGTLTVLDRLQRLGFLRPRAAAAALRDGAGRVALQASNPRAPVSTLSGGNQQKVLLARWLLLSPDIYFLDDPTRGIDVAAKQDIYRIVDALAAGERGVILVSSELPELLRCCDRILVLCEGRAAALYDAREATPEMIMSAATSFSAPAGSSAG